MKSPSRPKGRIRFAPSLRLEESLSLAAFMMSLAITLINLYYSMRGSEIAVDQPQQVILYRDGEGESSVLTAAVRLDLINVADGYGDVLKDAALSLARGGSAFDYQGTVTTVFGAPGQTAPDCELGMRCLSLPGLYVVERSDTILDMPSGAARAFVLSFPLVGWNCGGGKGTDCTRFASFDRSLAALSPQGLDVGIALRFHSDGKRRLRCVTGPVDVDYLKKVGWVSLPCRAGTRTS